MFSFLVCKGALSWYTQGTALTPQEKVCRCFGLLDELTYGGLTYLKQNQSD